MENVTYKIFKGKKITKGVTQTYEFGFSWGHITDRYIGQYWFGSCGSGMPHSTGGDNIDRKPYCVSATVDGYREPCDWFNTKQEAQVFINKQVGA
jgi:hypothetical protein